jgi:phage terminase large subunit-like protein
MCRLRAYTQSKTGQGSLSFAGTSLDLIWVDECPPDDLVGQLVTRTMTGNLGKGGHMRYTMTPELGATKLVTNFMEYRESTQKLIGPIAWSECPHLTDELQATILQGIPEHEQDMRSKGVPYFGSGLVYPIPEKRIMCSPTTEDGKPITSIPWLKYIRAIDIGINHPTAIVWLAYDAEIDRIYVLRTYSEADSAAAVHAAACNSYLDFAPCVFPHDIDNREKGSGKTVRQYYSEAGLKNTVDFKNKDGSISVEPGVAEINDRMRSDRFKVFNDCSGFFRELRMYHRIDGKIEKSNDDIMDAIRYGAMMVATYGVTMGGNRRRGRKPKVIVRY